MPTRKDKILQAYLAWKDRPVPSFAVPAILLGETPVGGRALFVNEVNDDNEQELTAEEEAVDAMLSLVACEAM